MCISIGMCEAEMLPILPLISNPMGPAPSSLRTVANENEVSTNGSTGTEDNGSISNDLTHHQTLASKQNQAKSRRMKIGLKSLDHRLLNSLVTPELKTRR